VPRYALLFLEPDKKKYVLNSTNLKFKQGAWHENILQKELEKVFHHQT
jgi:hypothetical protein